MPIPKNPHYGATFAERKAIREGRTTEQPAEDAEAKQVESAEVEDKAVKPAETKRPRARKKS